jgi:hypothetical protein
MREEPSRYESPFEQSRSRPDEGGLGEEESGLHDGGDDEDEGAREGEGGERGAVPTAIMTGRHSLRDGGDGGDEVGARRGEA